MKQPRKAKKAEIRYPQAPAGGPGTQAGLALKQAARGAAEQARSRWAGMSMGRAWFIWPLALVLVGLGWWSAVGPSAVGFAPIEAVGAEAEFNGAEVVLQPATPEEAIETEPAPLVVDLGIGSREQAAQADQSQQVATPDEPVAAAPGVAARSESEPAVRVVAVPRIESFVASTNPQLSPTPTAASPRPISPSAEEPIAGTGMTDSLMVDPAAPLPWGGGTLALASRSEPAIAEPAALPFTIDAPTSPPAESTAEGAARRAAEHLARPVPPAMPDSSRTRRVVYMVDLSGSLVDSLPEAIRYIGDELDRLEQPAVFTVLFFRRGEVIEPPPHGLKPATFDLKWEVYDWIRLERGHLEAGGKATLSDAVLAALRYEVDRVVLLSDDGFGRDRSWVDGPTLLDDIAMTLPNADTVIDTVQFFYRDAAGAMEAIADRFGGGYTFINRPMPDTEPEFVDLYGELRQQGTASALK